MFEPWMLAAMEDRGLTDTSTGLVNRVAYKLAQSSSGVIDTQEFRKTCYECNVDPDSFTQKDLEQLQDKLNKIT